MIEGVLVRGIDVQLDERGSFAEVFSDRWDLPIEPRQWSLVRSVAGTLRGMHLHIRHDEYLLPIIGRCTVGLHDLRPGSATLGESMLVDVDASDPKLICFPRGVVHGWYFPIDTLHLQAVSEPFSEYGGDDNLGCHFADPALGIGWPAHPHVVSERAQSFSSLTDLKIRAEALWPR